MKAMLEFDVSAMARKLGVSDEEALRRLLDDQNPFPEQELVNKARYHPVPEERYAGLMMLARLCVRPVGLH